MPLPLRAVAPSHARRLALVPRGTRNQHTPSTPYLAALGCRPISSASSSATVENEPASMPLSFVGPLAINGRRVHVPLGNANEELVHRVNVGCYTIDSIGGAFAQTVRNSITVSPLLVLPTSNAAFEFVKFVEDAKRISVLQKLFAECSPQHQLESVRCNLIGKRVIMRCMLVGNQSNAASVKPGIDRVFEHLKSTWTGDHFEVISDQLGAVDTSGKHVTATVTLPIDVVGTILNSSPEKMLAAFVERKTVKAQIMQNVPTKRLLSSLLLATGQDRALQSISANALETTCAAMRSPADEQTITAFQLKCTIPSIELNTIDAPYGVQHRCLEMIGVNDASKQAASGQNFTEIVCGTLLALEIGMLAQREAKRPVSTRMAMRHRLCETQERSTLRTNLRYHAPPAPEALRGMMTSTSLNSSRSQAYIDLVAEKCAAEFGWADPRLTVP